MTAPRVERSVDPAMPESTRTIKGIEGLEDVPRSFIHVPYYSLVQPESSKAILPDGKRSPNGSFLMTDVRKVVDELRFVILRAKRQTRVLGGEKIVSLNVLGFNLERKTPFILSVPVTSFSAFGRYFAHLQEVGAKTTWEYIVDATPEEVSDKKQTDKGIRDVTWWVIRLDIEAVADDKLKALAKELYEDYGEKLDRNDEDDDLSAIAGKVFNNNK